MEEPVLVTGGMGFIGKHICKKLENHVILDKEQRKGKNHITADILDFKTLSEKCKDISKIIHLAAIVGVPFSTENPKIVWEVNTTGTLNLLEIARKNDIERFVYASSNAIYGEYPVLKKGIPEDFRKKPTNIYAASKLAGEHLVSLYNELYGLNTVSLRYANAYGPEQIEDNVIWIFIKRASKGENLLIFGDGNSGRDFTYITDIVEGTLLTIKSRKTGPYNIASGETTTIKKVAEIVKSSFKSVDIEKSPPRAGDASQGALDISRARKDFSYKPKTSIEKGIKRCIDWYKKTKEFRENQSKSSS